MIVSERPGVERYIVLSLSLSTTEILHHISARWTYPIEI